MKKPQLLEITEDELHWVGPSWKARVQMFKNRAAKVWKVIKRILWNMAIPLLIAVVMSIIFLANKPESKIIKYREMTLAEQLDYYQAEANLYKLNRER